MVRLCVGLGLCLAVGCAKHEEAEPLEVFPVTSPGEAKALYEREYVGEVNAVQRAELRARTSGLLESVAVDEGREVKAGQLLFSFASRGLQQQVKKARATIATATAELKAAELEHANVKMLHDKQVVSPAELARVDAKVQALAAKLEEARADEGQAAINLSHAEVRAPFDGVVNRIPKKAGSMIQEGELLTTVTNASEVLVYFRVSENEYLDYAANPDERAKEVSFKLADGSALEARGVIDAVETEVDRGTGTLAFRARFPNPRRLLKHGASGKVVLHVPLQGGLTVPQKATFEIQDHVYVYALDAQNRAHAKRIVPKLRLADTFVLESGLQATDRFILEGIQKVKEGATIVARQ